MTRKTIIDRDIASSCIRLAKQMPALGILGPRQSGKTTIAKHLFGDHHYVSLEDLDFREFAQRDPRGFIATHLVSQPAGAIFDEIQRVPELFSYLQGTLDDDPRPGRVILTGSQNFLLNQHISQSLAGRIALLTLLPLSLHERRVIEPSLELNKALFEGSYARVCVEGLAPQDWYPNYIRTYLERDVRQLKNVQDLSTFQRFVKLCAGRVGQLVDLTSLGNDCGISFNTARAWISLLEASYLVFLLQPHHKNFSKRVIKTPKLYFYDTGVVCSLLGIESPEQLASHYLKGGIFESFVISELLKVRFHANKAPNCYFWRDKTGNEVDCLFENGQTLVPIEIKSGQTITDDYFKGLRHFTKLAGSTAGRAHLIYGGDQNQSRTDFEVLSWRECARAVG